MAAWRRAWRWWRVSSKDRGAGAGAGDSLQLTPYHPNQRSDLVESSNNFGSSYTTGTTLSINTHTTTSSDRVLESARVFHPSVLVPTPAAVVQEKAEEEKLNRGKFLDEERAKAREHIKVLARAANGPDRWLSELRVGWVLHPGEVDAFARRIQVSQRFQDCAEGWILAVYAISRSISSFNGRCSSLEEAAAWPPASELVRFVAATLLKMLPFVDTVVTVNTVDDGGAVPPANKFQALVDVRDALSRVSERFQLWASWLHLPVDVEAVGRINETSSILFAELGKLDEAIWDTRRSMGNRIMSLMDDDGDSPWRARAHQRSAEIHKATRSTMSYINVLSTSYDVPLNPTVRSEASLHVTQPKNLSPLTDLIMEMVHSLEEKIDRKSLSFHDHSLKFLFLINNSYFMWQQLHTNRLMEDVPTTTVLALKINDYINNYIQVSWTPVLKCLHNDRAPRCFTIYSPLHRFESEFQKTYRAQKLWKVPDPTLRKRLRKAIIEELVQGITEFLKDNSSISNPEVNPEKLEEMLEELFEG